MNLPPARHPDGPYRVVMVCTGNICWSPMAEAVLRDHLQAAGMLSPDRAGVGPSRPDRVGAPGVEVISAGVSGEEYGNPMDPCALRILREAGYGVGPGADDAAGRTMRTHRAHHMSDAELTSADLVLAMTRRQVKALRRRAGPLRAGQKRIQLYRAYDPLAVGLATVDLDVPDPWYGDHADFVDTLAVVERVSQALVEALAGAR